MKRSAQVGLVIMSAVGVGGLGYAMMPSEKCQQVDNGAPLDPSSPACRRSSGSGSGYHGSRTYFGSSNSGDSASTTTTKPSTPSGGGGTSRGGFGSFFSSLGSHISGS